MINLKQLPAQLFVSCQVILWYEMLRQLRQLNEIYIILLLGPFHNYFIPSQLYFILLLELFITISFLLFLFFATLISFLELYHNYFIFCQAYFFSFIRLFYNYFFSLPGSFHSFPAESICLVLMGSNHNTCDLLFASIYIFSWYLIYIMASNANKYKYQRLGGC